MTLILELRGLLSSGRKSNQVVIASSTEEDWNKGFFVFSVGSPKPPVFDFPYASGNDGMLEYGCESVSEELS